MKKFFASFLAMIFTVCGIHTVGRAAETGDCYVLMEAGTGEVIAEKNADSEQSVYGLTKLMSLLVIYDAIGEGTLKADMETAVSREAAKKTGVRAFLDSGAVYTVDELLLPAVMCGANDAVAALAETVSGSEEAFVDAMNEKADKIGISASFADCTGLSPENKATPRGLAQICAALSQYAGIFKLSSIGTETFVHKSGRETELANANRLIRESGYDGLMTSSNGTADYAVAATYKSGSARYICVVTGAANSASRFETARQLVGEADAMYSVKRIAKQGSLVKAIEAEDVSEGEIQIYAKDDLAVLYKKGEDIKKTIEIEEIVLPLSAGDKVGEISVEGKGSVDLIVKQDYEISTFMSAASKVIRDRLGLLSI